MAIPSPRNARKVAPMHGVGGFLSNMLKNSKNTPATLNKWSVSFSTPSILQSASLGGGSGGETLTLEKGTAADLLDYYANTVNLPSRQLTTAQFQPPGASVKYATNQAFSEMSIEFTIPRSQYTRAIFETWLSRITRDSNQYVDFYERYTAPRVRIYKWETNSYTDRLDVRFNNLGELTGCWEMQNVFPYNIGSIELNNEQNTKMTLSIGFFYERYRFYAPDEITDPGNNFFMTVPAPFGGVLGDFQEGSQILNTFTRSGQTFLAGQVRPFDLAGSFSA